MCTAAALVACLLVTPPQESDLDLVRGIVLTRYSELGEASKKNRVLLVKLHLAHDFELTKGNKKYTKDKACKMLISAMSSVKLPPLKALTIASNFERSSSDEVWKLKFDVVFKSGGGDRQYHDSWDYHLEHGAKLRRRVVLTS